MLLLAFGALCHHIIPAADVMETSIVPHLSPGPLSGTALVTLGKTNLHSEFGNDDDRNLEGLLIFPFF